MKLDSNITSLLDLDPKSTSVSGHGGAGTSSASTFKITARLQDGSPVQYFLKTGEGQDAASMFEGEYASLNAIHNAVPTLCPKPLGHGRLAETPNHSFLVTDFIELSGRFSSRGSCGNGMSLAQKLAKLHTTPAPTPDEYDRPQFGFSVPTCCGDTAQDNTYTVSWAHFYANHRLRFILVQSRKTNGVDKELSDLVERTCTKVIPRLIGDPHLNGGKGITPVLTHGDLWSGNVSVGRLPNMTESEEVIYDSSACYTHSEYELGMMKMFGGFGQSFLTEYHQFVPKTEPVEEYDDRVELYELFHHLNHYSMFGRSYRGGAVSVMRRLIGKYGGAGNKSEV